MPWFAANAMGHKPDDLIIKWGVERLAKDKHIWTVRHTDGRGDWETESSCEGYGLLYEVAKFLVDAANEKEARDEEQAKFGWKAVHGEEK